MKNYIISLIVRNDVMYDFIKIIIVAVGLSMDAFSLAILYGTLNFNNRKILALSTSVGLFHFFMPLLGNLIGMIVLKVLPISPNIVVGVIFLIISIEMIVSLFKQDEVVDLKGMFAIILFAFTVSIDSFSVGIGLFTITSNSILAVSIFSLVSFSFTLVGLKVGGKLTDIFGKCSTLLGGIILFLVSLFYLFFYTS